MNTVMNAIIHEERIFRLVPIDKDQAQGTAGSIITSIFGIEGKLYRVNDIRLRKISYTMSHSGMFPAMCATSMIVSALMISQPLPPKFTV